MTNPDPPKLDYESKRGDRSFPMWPRVVAFALMSLLIALVLFHCLVYPLFVRMTLWVN